MGKKFSSLFMKFFMPYMLIIIIFFGLSSIAYIAAFNVIESNAIKMQENYIKQSKAIIDKEIKEIFDTSTQIKQIPIVKAFSTKTKEDLEDSYFIGVQLLNQVKDIKIVNDSVVNYYVFYKNSMKVLENTRLVDYNLFYSDAFKIQGFNELNLFDTIFRHYYNGENLPATQIMTSSMSVYGIPFLMSIDYNYYNPEAVIMLLVDANKLKKLMPSIDKDTGGNFYILNEDDSILLSLYEDDYINGNGYIDKTVLNDKYMIFTESSDKNGWQYVLIQHKEEVFKEINTLRKVTNVLVVVILFIGLLTSYFGARMNSKPVQLLINDHKATVERMQEQRPFMRQAFLERWLAGNYQNEEEIKSVMKYLRTNYIGQYYCVIVIDYDEHINVLEDLNEVTMNELEMKRLVIKDIICHSIIQEEYIHDIEHDKFAMIFIGDMESKDEFKKYISGKINDCQMELKSHHIREIMFGVGQIYENLDDVNVSLTEAKDALLSHELREGSDVVWYDELEVHSESYYYPSDIENRLYNCARSGDKEQVMNILREILQINIFERNLSVNMLRLFIYEIWGTIAKIQERVVNNEVSKLITEGFEKTETLSDLEKIQYSKKIFSEICDLIYYEKQNKKQNIMESIKVFISENYTNPDFGLSMISEKYNLSEAYVSQMFKEHNGENFINYLQNLRIRKAEKLLRETKIPIKRIVIESGYNSSNTFGKAFKRMNGISASAYRVKVNE